MSKSKEQEWLEENSPLKYKECSMRGWVESVMESYAKEYARKESLLRVNDNLDILRKEAAEEAMDRGANRDVVDGLENEYNNAEEITWTEYAYRLKLKIEESKKPYNNLTDTQIMEKLGWVVECESPLEIRHEDGTFANNIPAQLYMRATVAEYRDGELF